MLMKNRDMFPESDIELGVRSPEVADFGEIQRLHEVFTTVDDEPVDLSMMETEARQEISNIFDFNEMVSRRSQEEERQVNALYFDVSNNALKQKTDIAVRSKRFIKRTARPSDLDALVRLDMLSFGEVYREYGKPYEEMYQELHDKFQMRFDMIGYDWTEILEDKEGTIVGFVMGCPTSRTPEQFESWEQMTDSGTLQSTYDKKGKNLYVVSLTVAPGLMATSAHNMLYVDIMGKAYAADMDTGFFESRLPGFRKWMEKEAEKTGRQLEEIPEPDLLAYAQNYRHTTRPNGGGKDRPVDPLLRSFSYLPGVKFGNVIAGAYNDEPSMHFGVITEVNNFLPGWLRAIRLPGKMIGHTLRTVAKSRKLTNKIL